MLTVNVLYVHSLVPSTYYEVIFMIMSLNNVCGLGFSDLAKFVKLRLLPTKVERINNNSVI